jgi:hypothetical protein
VLEDKPRRAVRGDDGRRPEGARPDGPASTAGARDDPRVLLPFGLCDACTHQRRVGNSRGSTFSLCGLARTDERFAKYPRMPVLRCGGFAARPEPVGADDGAAGPPGEAGDADAGS